MISVDILLLEFAIAKKSEVRSFHRPTGIQMDSRVAVEEVEGIIIIETPDFKTLNNHQTTNVTIDRIRVIVTRAMISIETRICIKAGGVKIEEIRETTMDRRGILVDVGEHLLRMVAILEDILRAGTKTEIADKDHIVKTKTATTITRNCRA